MNEKTKDKLTDVIGGIAAAPVIAGSKIMEAAQKIGSQSGKSGTVGEDLSSAASKAKQAVSETAQKIAKGDAAKKVKDSIEQLSYTDTSAKLQNALDKTQTVVKNIGGRMQDGLADSAQKAKEGFADIKENVQERKDAAAQRAAEKALQEEIAGEFFEVEMEEAEEAEDAAADFFAEEEAEQESAETEEEKATLQEKAEEAEEKIGQFVERSAAVVEDKAEGLGAKLEGFVEKIAEKADDAAAGMKASAEKLEESIVKKDQ